MLSKRLFTSGVTPRARQRLRKFTKMTTSRRVYQRFMHWTALLLTTPLTAKGMRRQPYWKG
jgi:hypothetical protein